ncbi:hypothetical protein AB1L30_26940 [Bremerella sp. JC817]|uniref:hypothetical protein n=1 Tax=Bremerella sp. JC817 TaxID=3231756 RepID=UPI00345AC4B4
MIRSLPVILMVLAAATTATAQQPLPLIDSAKPLGGWTFDNGKEFPGAVGKLELQTEDAPTLVLHGDFSQGGMYVQAARRLAEIPLESISFDIKVPSGVDNVTSRLIDGTGQCHQLNIRLNDKGGWQTYVFPVARYFASLEAGTPMDIVTRYEKWSGANDGRWHQPAKLFVILAGKEAMSEGSIAIRNVRATEPPPKVDVATTIPLSDFTAGENGGWQYNPGSEFPGAAGSLSVIEGRRESESALRLEVDFTEGGRYVGVRKRFPEIDVKQTESIDLWVRSDKVKQFSIRLVDSTNQTHQRHGIAMKADGQWQSLSIDPQKIAGGEHWGGAKDGRWHGGVQLVEIMLNPRSASEPMRLDLANIQMQATVEGEVSGQAWREAFDGNATQPWQIEGDVSQKDQLTLTRTLETIQSSTSATSAKFPVRPGSWELAYRVQSKLHSPDNSFHGAVELQVFNRGGELLETLPLGIGFGNQGWSTKRQLVKLPAEASAAQWHVQLNKTYGTFQVDDLSAARLVVQPSSSVVESIRIASEAIGNLFYPGDAVAFEVKVPTNKPLPQADRRLGLEVRDYRGEVVLTLEEVPLVEVPGANQREFQAAVQLDASPLNVGQFYELHVSVPQGEGNPVTELSGFAILPEAISKQYAPEEIPFTIRNWDSRVNDYFYLADRLGLRMMGVWGGWSQKPPYKPHLPGLETVQKLNAKWITGTPASSVEREGFKTVSEESLREGMTNFLEAYADEGLAMIAMGNEPHGKGQVVLDNVRAYKTVYEAVKAFDPKIHVIGTSVEPNDEYFRAGYQNYLDSYDFHIYEHYTKVRRTMHEYRELMQKYDAVKPIHSTELGLNSQGQARLSVSIELIKKCTVFFAEGGETVSWFTIMYPDKKGNARGQFGDAHCVFDCKFNNYNPRLDAITYYHMINSLAAKKFVSEKQHPDGTQEFLFEDEQKRCLMVLWNDEGTKTAEVSVPPNTAIDSIRIDGQHNQLRFDRSSALISVSPEPVLLLFERP